MDMPTQDLLWLIGRALLGGLFVAGGIRHCFAFAPVAQAIAARGLPFPKLVLAAGTLLQTVAGLLLIAGVAVPWATFGLVVFTVLASAMFLNFWDMEGVARDNAVNGCLSNLAIIGGLLVAASRAS